MSKLKGNKMEFTLIGLPILFWFLNSVRGGGTSIGQPEGKLLATGAWGVAVSAFTMNPLAGLLAAGGYFVGETFSWGKWISASPHFFDKTWQNAYNNQHASKKTGRDSGIHQIVSLIFDERKNFTNYCIACLFLRGIWWFAPTYAALQIIGGLSIEFAVIATIASGAAMPAAYYVAGQADKISFWTLGEKIYGAFYGAILAVVLATMM
jgi:hypothetical protein